MPIHDKLLQFQRQGITLKKDGLNPHFGSSYATLNEVLDKVKEPLNKLNILIQQNPEKEGLRTILLDTEDGSKVESFMPYVETSTAQKLGSNNTYVRRYALVTMLGLEDADDDGNEASKPKMAPKLNVDPRVPPKSHDLPIVQQDAPIGVPQCNHKVAAKRLQTKKPGPNQGRYFYACALPKDKQCDFFQWEDEGDQKVDIEGTRADFNLKTGAYEGGYDDGDPGPIPQ